MDDPYIDDTTERSMDNTRKALELARMALENFWLKSPSMQDKLTEASKAIAAIDDALNRQAQDGAISTGIPPHRALVRAVLAMRPAAPRAPLTDEQIADLMPPADGTAEANVVRLEVLPGVMGTEFEEVDAWSRELVIQTVRAALNANGIGQEGSV